MNYKVAYEINDEWNSYDKTVAACHLDSYGKIYVDEYGCPIDNEYVLEEIEMGEH